MRSDTIDVKIYKLFIDVTDFNTNIIKASCQVNFESKMNNVSGISLDLLNLQVDSVKYQGQHANHTYNGVLLRINFPTTLNQFDEDSVIVYYQGTPVTDASGFGGFYFQNGFAYNLGVGFEANPHNFGRVWHPCFDNFVERAQYEMTFRTTGTKRAYANGLITHEDTSVPGEMLRTWLITDPIPSYLACFTVGDYTHVTQNYESPLYGNSIPVMLVARPQDTTGMKTSFNNLFDMMEVYEAQFGPYVWEKISFALVPFNSGAMEHATLVAYPQSIGAGNTTFDWLIAHELSHHWWGNLVTCKTASDMWINEGFAVYSEAIYFEGANGYNSYLNDLKNKHRLVLQRAHFNDGGFFPISGVPNGAVYGDHSYRKGAIMLHNMRTYIGDEAFFEALQAMQSDFAHSAVDAYEVRDKIAEVSGIDMTDFFDDWVFQPGFVGVILDSFQVIPNGEQFDVIVSMRQKLRMADNFFSAFPMQVSFVEDVENEIHETFTFSGEQMTATFTVPFAPKMVYLNGNDGIMNAVTAHNYLMTENGTILNNYSYSRAISPASNPPGTRLIRIEHCRVAPDDMIDPDLGIQISTQRYWRVDGVWDEDFSWNTWFVFDGRNSANGNLDMDLMQNPHNLAFIEDSLKLLYRPNPASPWTVVEDADLGTQGSATDGSGRFIKTNVQKGEYTFGFKFSALSLEEIEHSNFVIFPNPAQGSFTFKAPRQLSGEFTIKIYDNSGRKLNAQTVTDGQIVQLAPSWKGILRVVLERQGQIIGSQNLIVE